MGVLERDPAETATTLAAWLATRPGIGEPRVDHVDIPASTGWSNETILFDARWHDDRGEHTHELVARIAPSGYQVFPDDTFLRQHTVMKALAERSTVPAARVHWLDEDPRWFGQPFWIMERVAGDIATDAPPYASAGWLHDATTDQQARAWWSGVDALVGVATVDLDALELPAGTLPGADDPLGWHLEHVERFLTWAEDGTPHPLARRADHRDR